MRDLEVAKPIIFSTLMVRAIEEDRKRKTRRVAKPQPPEDWAPHSYGDIHLMKNGEFVLRNDEPVIIGWGACNESGDFACKSRYKPGDILWVRETWMPFGEIYVYLADGDMEDKPHLNKRIDRWRPSIHMPRAAARIFLQTTDARMEQLQDICEADAHAEGMESPSYPIIQFKDLWNDLNEKRGFEWDTNPWVWVYTFERVKEAREACS